MEANSHSVHTKSVIISKLLYVYLNHKTGDSIKFDLLNASTEGKINSLELLKGPTKDGYLSVQLRSPSKTKLKYDVSINPCSSNHYSVLMLHSKSQHKVMIPNLDREFIVTGPALLIIGINVYIYDGNRVHCSKFNPISNNALSVFWVGTAFSIQSSTNRHTIPVDAAIVQGSEALLAFFNQAFPSSGSVPVLSDTDLNICIANIPKINSKL